MIWLQVLSQIWLQYTTQKKQLEAVPEKMKGMSIQAGIYFAGLVVFLVLALAAVIMIFIDLGKQWDTETPTHFTGFMGSALLMAALGSIVFGILVLIARYLARKKEAEAPKHIGETHAEGAQTNPLLLFGEEFISQLLKKLKQ